MVVYSYFTPYVASRIQSIVGESTERTENLKSRKRNDIYLTWGLNTADVCLCEKRSQNSFTTQVDEGIHLKIVILREVQACHMTISIPQ